jgi:hypothetical protein
MFSDFACLSSGALVRHLLKMQPLSTIYAYLLLLFNILLVIYPVVFSGKKKSKSCRRKTKKTPVMGFFFIYFSISALTLSAYTCKKEQRFEINYSHLNLGKVSGLTEREFKAFKKLWRVRFATLMISNFLSFPSPFNSFSLDFKISDVFHLNQLKQFEKERMQIISQEIEIESLKRLLEKEKIDKKASQIRLALVKNELEDSNRRIVLFKDQNEKQASKLHSVRSEKKQLLEQTNQLNKDLSGQVASLIRRWRDVIVRFCFVDQ